MARSFAALATLAGAFALAGPAAAGEQHFFFAPGMTTSCEVDVAMPKIGTTAYCQAYPHT